ncbi:MAG: ZIP family metal transporter [Bacteroidetes bacterium]|nr:ZIP family metal transporter [Bacteroidota bacterium]
MWVYLLLIFTAVASGALIFLIKSDDQRFLKFLLAFSGAFLIGITFLSLVPEVFSSATAYTGLFVLAGFLLQLVLELITEGAEHGHKHQHTDNEKVSPFLLLIGLCIHAFLEGMPISGNFNPKLQDSLVIGIIIHNIPISLTLVGLFLHYGCSRKKALVYLLVFALMSPLGSGLSYLLNSSLSASMEAYFNNILAVVIGIFLHVSTSILFETEENHRYNLQKFLTVCAGLMVAFLVSHH